jgi:hypothetical protein
MGVFFSNRYAKCPMKHQSVPPEFIEICQARPRLLSVMLRAFEGVRTIEGAISVTCESTATADADRIEQKAL